MQRAASEIRRPLSRQTKAGTASDYHGPLRRTDGASEPAWHRGTPKDFLNTSMSAQAPLAHRQHDVGPTSPVGETVAQNARKWCRSIAASHTVRARSGRFVRWRSCSRVGQSERSRNIPQRPFFQAEKRGMTKFSRSQSLLATLFLHALLTPACSSGPGESDGPAEQDPAASVSDPLESPGNDAKPNDADQANQADQADQADQAGAPKSLCPQPTRVEEDIEVPGFVSPSFRYKAIDYTLESAITHRTTVCKDEKIDVTEVLVLHGTATNRIAQTLELDLDLRLALSDGARLSGTKEAIRLVPPEGTADFTFQFKLPSEVILAGAKIEPKSSSDAGEHHRVSIPLDAILSPPYPIVIEELAALEAKTLSEDSRDQWSIKVLSATVTLDTDYDGGEHAPYGKKYIELIVDAHLLATSVNSLFSYNTFELNVGGFSVYPSVEGGVLQKNQRETNIILFEVDEDVTEFDFIYDLDSIDSAKDSPDYGTTQRTISVRLPTPAAGE